jgi:hypothetical protein
MQMFTFANILPAIGMWLVVLFGLFFLNELTRRWKIAGFIGFVIVPIILTILWFTVLKETTYTDWFHLAKVYSSTAGCIGFWLIRHLEKKDKETGKVIWRLSDNKYALLFPPLILGVNILEAVVRDFEIGSTYYNLFSGPLEGEVIGVMGGAWNYMNGIAGILNIIAITGWFGIVIRRQTKNDKSKDMLWPDMLWFWIIAYDVWNFTYTYNAIPTHSFYAGMAMLLAPTLCAFTIGKGAWLQHRAQTLAIWCMFAQTFTSFQDQGKFMVQSTYNKTIYMTFGVLALTINLAVVVFMVYKVVTTKRNPYKGELYTDLKQYKQIKALAE